MPPDAVARCIEEAGVGFMYAPTYHPAMKAVVPVRKALKVCVVGVDAHNRVRKQNGLYHCIQQPDPQHAWPSS